LRAAGLSPEDVAARLGSHLPIFACPVCSARTPPLFEISSDFVNYYRCPNCTHVWTVSKTDSTDVRHMTPPPKSKDDAG
jgi:hypothetical protein